MSCLIPCYNPIPPRAWSRVQNECTFTDTVNASPELKIRFLNKEIPLSHLPEVILQYNKGNILQYKNNNSNMSKKQKYAQIAKGLWKPRNVTWASQKINAGPLQTVPNLHSLQRVNYKKIYLATGAEAPANVPLTCPSKYYDVSYNSIVVADGGTLVCGTVENICTGKTLVKEKSGDCNPSSNSDVPGPIVPLCWNDGYATWYPKPRRVMSNSGNKFPEGYKGFVSAVGNCKTKVI